MDRDFFQKYYDSQVEATKKYLFLVCQTSGSNGINDFKSALKNIFAIFRLVKEMNPDFSPPKKIKKVKNLFKTVNKISNLQNQQKIVRTWMKDKNHEMNGYYNYLKNKEMNSRLKFEKAVKKFDNSILKIFWFKISKKIENMHLDYIKFKTERRFENQINKLIKIKSDKEFTAKEIVKSRLLAKEAQSLFDIILSSNPTSQGLKKLNQSLGSINHILEKCNELNIGLNYLSKFIEKNEHVSSQIKTLYSEFSKDLIKDRDILLNEFDGKWEIFLDIAQKEREWISILQV